MPPPSDAFSPRRFPFVATAAVFALFTASCASRPSPRAEPTAARPTVSPSVLATLENDRGYRLILAHKYADAEPVLRKALAYDDRHGPAHNNLGLVYAKLGRPYDAAREYETAARLMAGAGEPLNNLGLVLEDAGKLSDAVDAFEAARKRDGDDWVYLANLARARVRRGDRGEDVIRLLESLQVRTNDPHWRDWAVFQLLRLRAGH